MRRGIQAIVTAAIACALLAPGASAHEADDPSSAAEASAEAVLEQAKAAVGEPPAGEPSRELTLVLAQLSQAVPALHGEDRRVANRILARPDDGPGDRYGDGFTAPEAAASPACDANFCVHWVARSRDRPRPRDNNGTDDGDGVPDFVEEVLASAQDSFAVENTNLGWVEPLGDGTRGGGGTDLTDIYLLELDGNYFGYSSPDEGLGPVTSKQAYLVLDNDYDEFGPLDAIDALQVTMAHEYNHVLQFAYDNKEDGWMFESTATWMENNVYPAIDDYLHYVPAFAKNSLVPLTGNSGDGLKIYGAAVWNHYLQGTGSADLVRDAWAGSPTVTPPHLSVAAYDDALGGTGNPFSKLGETFTDFAASTAEWRGDASEYADAAGLPDMKRAGRLEVDGRARKLTLDHLSFALLKVRAAAAHLDDLSLAVRTPAGTQSGVAIIGRRGGQTSGDASGPTAYLPLGGDDQENLSGDPAYTRVTAVVVNADPRVNGSGRYLRDDQRYRVRVVSN